MSPLQSPVGSCYVRFEAFTVVTMKNTDSFVALIRIEVSEERISSIIMAKKTSELVER
jgi:hypothetical protein